MNPSFVLPLRAGAILATLVATPVIVGFIWNAVWDVTSVVTPETYVALLLAWVASAGSVAGLAYNLARTSGANAIRWFYPCAKCGQRVALIQYLCSNCETAFQAPPEAISFRNILFFGTTISYALFAIAAFTLHG